MFRAAVIVILLSVYCLVAGCNCDCMNESSCTLPEKSDSVAVETSVTVESSSETLVR